MRTRSLLFCLMVAACVQQQESQARKIKVGIQPLDEVNTQYSETVKHSIQGVYGFEAYILPSQSIPKRFEVSIKGTRFRADSIIHHYKKHKPDSLDIILAITEKDISVTKRDWLGRIKEPKEKYIDWGVFGYGYVPGPSCVVSVFRLKKDHDKTLERLAKVALHEVGHNLGLPHCESNGCVMRDAAESIKTVDQVKAQLCEHCKREIQ